ncbi:hypothetical protein FMK57_04360 [Klebsiella oxytoca]|nr:hypothetical protein [Klebsiella oxytoca]
MIGIRFRRWPRSHKSAGYGSGQASSSTGYSPYGFPFVGRSCDLDFFRLRLSGGLRPFSPKVRDLVVVAGAPANYAFH